MRKGTKAAALLVSLALASPGFAQNTTGQSASFSMSPSSFTYTRVDTSKAVAPSTSFSSAKSLGNFQSVPINVTNALQKSFNPISMANNDPTRALKPRQPTSNFQIPNVFSRITTLSLVPSFLQPRTTTTTFPNVGPQSQ
jgi:hypothetical protein